MCRCGLFCQRWMCVWVKREQSHGLGLFPCFPGLEQVGLSQGPR